MSRSNYKFKYFCSFFYKKLLTRLSFEKNFNTLFKLGSKKKYLKPHFKKYRKNKKFLKTYVYKLIEKPFVITKRSSIINSFLVTQRFKIHKGLYSTLFKITIYHIGYKFGEFSFTKKPFHYGIIKKKKR